MVVLMRFAKNQRLHQEGGTGVNGQHEVVGQTWCRLAWISRRLGSDGWMLREARRQMFLGKRASVNWRCKICGHRCHQISTRDGGLSAGK